MNNNSTTQFEVYVSNDTFKFNAAHFVAYENYRERLHGHNYRVSVRLIGERQRRPDVVWGTTTNTGIVDSSTTPPTSTTSTPILGPDGYLIDFTNVKKITKEVCQQLNEHFICPIYSNVLDISTIYLNDNDNDNHPSTGSTNDNTTPTRTQQEYIQIVCHMDQTKFIFPRNDCILLPIVHATAEELAIYIYCQIINKLNASYLLQRNIYCMEITIAESIGQEATFRHPIPTSISTDDTDHQPYHIDVRQFIMSGNIVPMPCISSSTTLLSSSVQQTVQLTPPPYNNTQNGTGNSVTNRTTNLCTDVVTSSTTCCPCCRNNCANNSLASTSLSMFSTQQLQQIVDAINSGSLLLQSEQQQNNNTTDANCTLQQNDAQQQNTATSTTSIAKRIITVEDLQQILSTTV
jgi:dihydroneopterin triphosphate aldolase (PTPS-III) / 6-pyruvoyltetrahydropterin synthase